MFRVFCLIFVALLTAATPAFSGPNKYASIIIDADSFEILHARNIDGARYPASLTKMMTLYLAFEAIEAGNLSLSEPLRVSARAARAAPVKLGLRAGSSITAEQAIMALTVRSANDAAMVLAERMGGSSEEFARGMTDTARRLGMQSTIFQNPHGLPDPGQTSTARDMAKLASALLRTYPQYYHYFSLKSFTYKGRTYNNHNTLLGKVDGVDGFKTGYTNASGYNLVISAKRGERRIIAVVLGGASGKSRDIHMTTLINRGFTVIETSRAPSQIVSADETPAIKRKVLPVPSGMRSFTLRASSGEPTAHITQGGAPVTRYPAGSWSVQIGAFTVPAGAEQINAAVLADPALPLKNARALIIPVTQSAGMIYRARITGLEASSAQNTCQILTARRQACIVIAPG